MGVEKQHVARGGGEYNFQTEGGNKYRFWTEIQTPEAFAISFFVFRVYYYKILSVGYRENSRSSVIVGPDAYPDPTSKEQTGYRADCGTVTVNVTMASYC